MSLEREYTNIRFPKDSADGYYMKKSQKLVNEFIYIDPEWYKQLFDPNTYYILGPKGSGKTLYAAYMCAEIRENTVSKSHTIDVGDYGKLIKMKTDNQLNYTDYLTMWKVVLLQKLLLGLDASEISFWGRTKNFQVIQNTISEYFGYDVSADSFNPITIIDNCSKQDEATEYLSNQLELGGATVPGASFSAQEREDIKRIKTSGKTVEKKISSYTDTWLRAINAFQKTLEKITFKYNHYLFVDGLDVRPQDIDAKEYGECIGALIRAVYALNTNVFGNMTRKDSYEFKIIALTRTDIFLNSDLVNVTSCINDNCVELDWTYSNEKEFEYSKLYKMMNRVLGWDGKSEWMPVEVFFGFKLPFPASRPLKASLYIQRQTRLRPRDIVVLLKYIQNECRTKHMDLPNESVFYSSELISRYSTYYTDQIKSEMQFTYSSSEIKSIFELIKMMKSDTFEEEVFKKTFDAYCETNPKILSTFPTHRKLIDVLYSLDVLGWLEHSPRNPERAKTHWHYREVKAIDEAYRLPWEQFDKAFDPKIMIHSGASKHIIGRAKKYLYHA